MAKSTRDDRRLGWTRFFVPDPSFGWYVRGVGVGSLVAVVVFSGLLWWFHGRLLDVIGLYDLLDEPGVRDAVIRYAKLSLIVTGSSVLGAAVWMVILSVFFLHRIAGPIYRLKAHMLGMIAGDAPKELSFRKTDQLKDLCGLFNEFVEHFGLLTDGEADANAAETPIRVRAGSRF